jgi:tetratricopeptide (TPR) repeat protein
MKQYAVPLVAPFMQIPSKRHPPRESAGDFLSGGRRPGKRFDCRSYKSNAGSAGANGEAAQLFGPLEIASIRGFFRRAFLQCRGNGSRMPLKRMLFSGLFLPAVAGCALAGRPRPQADDITAARQLLLQGLAAIEAGQWDRGETLLRKSIEASPEDAISRRYLAEAQWRRGALEDALVQIDAAVRADNADASTIVRSAEMLMATQSFSLAAERADQAIRLDPKLPAAWAARGRAFWHMNQMERALADQQRALDLAPNDRELLLDIANIYQQIGQPTRCLTTVQRLVDTYPPGQVPQQALLLEGLTLKELGRHRQAAESLFAANQAGSPSAEILCQLAQVYSSLGDYQRAMQAAQQALAVDANHIASRELLTQLAARAPDQSRR